MTPLRSTEDLCRHLALEHPQWTCSELKTLSGGNANLSCRGKLSATAESVFIKHAEDILGQGWSLPASRAYHEQLLRAKLQEDLAPVSHGATLVGTPKLLSYLPDCHTQMLEDVQAVDLKSYLFKERISAQASLELGQALGLWAQRFHEWGRSPAQADLRDALRSNDHVFIKHAINQGRLDISLSRYPELYDTIREDMPELTVYSKPQGPDTGIIHGDFWCGNLLLSPPGNKSPTNWSIYVNDFELTQVSLASADLGQMLAELYLLYHFWSRSEALEIMKGLLSTYKLAELTEELRFQIGLQFGVHLVVWPPFTQTWIDCGEERLKDCVQYGVDCISAAHRKDKHFWKSHVLGALFR